MRGCEGRDSAFLKKSLAKNFLRGGNPTKLFWIFIYHIVGLPPRKKAFAELFSKSDPHPLTPFSSLISQQIKTRYSSPVAKFRGGQSRREKNWVQVSINQFSLVLIFRLIRYRCRWCRRFRPLRRSRSRNGKCRHRVRR